MAKKMKAIEWNLLTAASYGLAFASLGIQALCVRSSTCCPPAASASKLWSIKERLAHPPVDRWLIYAYVESWHAGCLGTAQPKQPSEEATTTEAVIAAPRSAPDALSPTPWEDTATWRLVLAQRHVMSCQVSSYDRTILSWIMVTS